MNFLPKLELNRVIIPMFVFFIIIKKFTQISL